MELLHIILLIVLITKIFDGMLLTCNRNFAKPTDITQYAFIAAAVVVENDDLLLHERTPLVQHPKFKDNNIEGADSLRRLQQNSIANLLEVKQLL